MQAELREIQQPKVVDAAGSGQRPTNSIFQNEWWLDAVAPGRWEVVEARSGSGALLGWMPIVHGDLPGRWLTSITLPPLTQTLGPWLAEPSSKKYSRRLTHYLQVLEELIEQIPAADRILQACHCSVPTALPFHQAGFRLETCYTYVLDDLTDEAEAWSAVSKSRRKNVTSAAAELEVSETDDIEHFVRLYGETHRRQGLLPPVAPEVIVGLDAACAKADARRILQARDESGRVHAMEYLVYDDRCVWDIMSGAVTSLRSSNAGSLLSWEAIVFALTTGRILDFEGSMSKSIEPMFRSLGATQVPYIQVLKESNRFQVAWMARDTYLRSATRIRRRIASSRR